VGIVGAGQLARMLCEAASPLGIETVVLAADPADAATDLAREVLVGSPFDSAALAELAERVDVVTFDHELVDLGLLEELVAGGHRVAPGPTALNFASDKAFQRRRFAAAGLPVPQFVVLDGTLDDDLARLEAFARELDVAPVVKSARGGYDGKGVVVASSLAEALDATARWRRAGNEVVAEAPIAFRTELAALLARRRDGQSVAWRTVRTAQLDGVCREIRVPGGVDDDTAANAAELARRVADVVGVVGVLAVELFDTDAGLLVNEVATRPHNSGHWTIEGATTSQFENHLRAILDLPLGAVTPTASAITTVNVFGSERAGQASLERALDVVGARVHLYGKAPRPGRKLGHVTVCGDRDDDVTARAWRAAAALGTPVPTLSGTNP
jgi:5-(carboxyamino)imidazole ribonucleotide synthase